MNRYRPHVLVLPEDDANRQIANGFVLSPAIKQPRNVTILRPARGWTRVRDEARALLPELERCPGRVMVLLVDFDGQPDRAAQVLDGVPDALRDRIFVLGAATEPEALKAELGKYETIGRALAVECEANAVATWGHPMLRHNADEATRLMAKVRPILF